MNNPKVLGGVAAAGLAFIYLTPFNPFHTPAVKNIGNAMAKGGGTTSHAPAIATPRGTTDDSNAKHDGQQGIDTQHFKENIASQHAGEPGTLAKKFNLAMHGQEKGRGGGNDVKVTPQQEEHSRVGKNQR